MAFYLSLFLLVASLPSIFAQDAVDTTVVVNGAATIAETDDNFICATIDWWPHDKCNYNQCPWGYTSAINLDLSHPFLAKAILAFKHLRIRIGGSLQDQVLYDVGNLKIPCHPFQKAKHGLFGFSHGCLHMDLWDSLNRFFSKTGALVTFGLNALHGRHRIGNGPWGGDWDSINARDLMEYTISKGYQIDSWEFGNELSGSGVGARVEANQYGKDLIRLKAIINELYEKFDNKPSLLAPGGFYTQDWYTKLLWASGSSVINVVTHHIYNLGPGDDPNLVNKILDPNYLSQITQTFSDLKQTLKTHGPWASAWVGESGGAYNSGGRLVSDTFVDSFWYLDQLGMSSKYGTKVYCRQTLIGGNYGLLNTTTFVPNPDYYRQECYYFLKNYCHIIALLWHRLMGKSVFSVEGDSSSFLRTYAHCTKGREGVTLLLINFSKQTEFRINVKNGMNINVLVDYDIIYKGSSFMHSSKRAVSWVGSKASDGPLHREEYHLTPKDGYIRSQTMVLNGKLLEVSDNGDIPTLEPQLVNVNLPISMAPLSMAFVVMPHFDATACK
ncbi:Glycoside hydrolase, family 79 [Dillenia turbinata]|uniref:Glycoside hydrolase, family 79 n=1 Tax=Dillenia turbinata TaxID=194707 RepID=A0AAN8V3V1_9MAGN